MSTAPIRFEELVAGAGRLGRVTLDVAATLNSLTLEMVDRLQAQLDQWRDRPGYCRDFPGGRRRKGLLRRR